MLSLESVCESENKEDVVYLGERVRAQRGLPTGHTGHIEGEDVGHPLDFMEDCIRVRHLVFVCHRGRPGRTHHGVYLSLDRPCTKTRRSEGL